MGRYILTGRIFDHLRQLTPGAGGELQLTDAIASLLKEEAVLFPWIRGGRGALAGAPIRAMMLEHSDVTARLERIRKLLPCKGAGCDEGCGALRDCVQRFEARLLRHMALENEVLFPRALRSDN